MHSTCKKREGLSFLLIILVLLTNTIGVYAHGTEEEHALEEPEAKVYYGTSAAISPFTYFGEGDYLTAFFATVLWVGILGGFYNLCLMLLARLTTKLK